MSSTFTSNDSTFWPFFDDPSVSTLIRWNLILRLVVLFLALCANSISVIVFMNSHLKDICYKYMLATSITNISYLIISIGGIFFYYCYDCSSSHSYFSAVYSIVFTFYIVNSMLLMRILLEVTISLRTFFILTNKNTNWLNYRVSILVLFVVSVLFYAEVPFSYKVVNVSNSTVED